MPERIASAVVEQVVEAYYPTAIQETAAARARAQNGYTIAAAVAAAIVAAGVFGDLAAETTFVKVLGFLVLAAWLLTAFVFLWAVAGRTSAIGGAELADANAFVRAVLDQITDERARIEHRTMIALTSTAVSMALTFVMLIGASLSSAEPERVDGALTLSEAGQEAAAALCGRGPAALSAAIRTAELSEEVVEVVVDEGCGSGRDPVTLQLPRTAIAGFAEE